MFEQIERLVTENSAAVAAVVRDATYNTGVVVGVLCAIAILAYTVYYHSLCDSNEEKPVKKQLVEWWSGIWSIIGLFIMPSYAISLLILHTPLEYFAAFLALRYLGLM